jgi:Flp pilus assembly protein CpaB
MLGAASAVLAAIILLAYLNQYRQSLNTAAAPTTVLVAKKLITKGTSAAVMGSEGLFQALTIPRDQVKDGAVADPATLKGRVATVDIYPGQQLTLTEFTATTTDAIPTRIVARERAIAVPFDASHGMIGYVRPGDRVDIYVGLNNGRQAFMKLLMENILVLNAPGVAGGGGIHSGGPSNFVFQVKGAEAAKLAFAADNARLWLVLRPSNNAKRVAPGLITARTLLTGRTVQVGQ